MKHVIALALVGALTSAGAPDPAVPEVRVVGSTVLSQEMESEAVKATVLVHGVRRIPGATVVYYSAGLPQGAEPQSWSSFSATAYDRASKASGSVGSVRLVDYSGEKIYAPLARQNKYGSEELMVSPSVAWPSDQPGGNFYTFFAVLPELPGDLETVDLMIGHGDIVHDLPIEDGVLEPATLQEGPLQLGSAWPLIDQTAAAQSSAPEDSVRPLVTKSQDEQ
ncbi:hypothetical protein [Kineosporia babensis]|uniref:Uncharacterized protein n=1 Tax=Kineosporia babensis TaxID=499548 RepID=A0A9X1SSL1_9ACTN|nr:hypothetical protein [Kineosporia babensis]MCD5309730.1 hypothetical protein [Kineosporia babensis]